ncbi:helix-turn-helix transcriptional regulator [Ferrimonas balearica]|uniref:helix-turn-helix transcriptional regulator n=1 Tax=Ferrimonas balearica TaxID=44012 RepID=UPI001F21EB84|nr:LuxR C-terminal-related transcriptional regulator [Ferrimonas balearica]MBY6019714.1 LuxR C-terminal-related transcriptional regulator [Halomonas denitrificans]MBY6096780.1 LuxR C-terminal-related transcriptional regulator [Ferrimonas balearica]
MQPELGWVFFSTFNEHRSCPTRVVETQLSEIEPSQVTAISVSDHSLRKIGAGIALGIKNFLKAPDRMKVGGETLSVRSYSIFSSDSAMPIGYIVIVSNKIHCQGLEQFTPSAVLRLVHSAVSKNSDLEQGFGELKLKTLQVLKMTALGLNAGEIADVLHLTSRGVDYHLSLAKQKVGAINKPNLIFEAKNLGWV